jgi:hypothetical protein
MEITNTSKEARVFRLCAELEEAKNRKKAAVRGFSDEVKRLQAEIKELVDSKEE